MLEGEHTGRTERGLALEINTHEELAATGNTGQHSMSMKNLTITQQRQRGNKIG